MNKDEFPQNYSEVEIGLEKLPVICLLLEYFRRIQNISLLVLFNFIHPSIGGFIVTYHKM